MQRKSGGWTSIGDIISGLDDPLKKALQPAPPAQRRGFTRFDQVDQLAGASETDADIGFMARLMALCSLPRTNPGDRLQYKRVNGPYKLVMIAGADNKLPYGNLPRLLMAWVCTEAVRTQNRELILGASLSEFMCKLGMASIGGARTRLRNQMDRLFCCQVELIYEDEHSKRFVASRIADRGEFWWNLRWSRFSDSLTARTRPPALPPLRLADGRSSVISPVAILATLTAHPIASPGRRSPFGPRGIKNSLIASVRFLYRKATYVKRFYSRAAPASPEFQTEALPFFGGDRLVGIWPTQGSGSG